MVIAKVVRVVKVICSGEAGESRAMESKEWYVVILATSSRTTVDSPDPLEPAAFRYMIRNGHGYHAGRT